MASVVTPPRRRRNEDFPYLSVLRVDDDVDWRRRSKGVLLIIITLFIIIISFQVSLVLFLLLTAELLLFREMVYNEEGRGAQFFFFVADNDAKTLPFKKKKNLINSRSLLVLFLRTYHATLSLSFPSFSFSSPRHNFVVRLKR